MEADRLRISMQAAHPELPRNFDIFGDAIDWIGKVAQPVWDGIVEVTNILVDGLKVTLNLIVDGVTYVYNAVIDTVERAIDALNFILNAVGVKLGKAVGWLLIQLGFRRYWRSARAGFPWWCDTLEETTPVT